MRTNLSIGGRRGGLRLAGITLAVALLGILPAGAQSGKGEAKIPETLRDQIVDAVKKFTKAAANAKARPGTGPVRAPRGPASPTDAFSTLLMNADNLACSFWKQWIKSTLDQASQQVARDGSTENLQLYQKLWGFRSKIITACDGTKEDGSGTNPGAQDEADASGPETKPCCDREFSEWWWAGWSLRNAERELKEAERRASEAERWLKKYGSDARRQRLGREVKDYQAKASARTTTPEMREFYRDRRKDAETGLSMIESMKKQAEEYRARARWLREQLPTLRSAEKAAKARYQECLKTCVKEDKRVGLRLGEGKTAASIASRPTASGQSLLISASGSISGLVVDEVRTKLGGGVPKKPADTALPPDWEMDRDGDEWVFTGPPPAGGIIALAIRFEGEVTLPADVAIQVLADGVLLVDETLSVVAMPAIETLTVLKDVLRLPQVVSSLETIEFVPSDLVRTPPGGLWEIDGQPVEAADWTAAVTGELSPRLSYTVPETWSSRATDTGVSVRYTDPWGERLVDAVTDDVVVADVPPTPLAQPSISGCTPRAFVGASICVCGFFPGDTGSRLTLNGQALGAPLSASSRVVNFALSQEQSPGPVEVAGEPSAGFSGQDRVSGAVLRVGGSIDRDKLLRGESTPLALWVEGTEEVVELRLTNKTPAIVSLQGGESQIVATSGGVGNRVEGMVRGLKPGPFNLVYELSADPCPCAGTFVASEESENIQ